MFRFSLEMKRIFGAQKTIRRTIIQELKKGVKAMAKKKLFIYYSFTGNGDEVASILKEKGYEVRKVGEKFKMPKSFFSQMMVGGFRAGLGLKGKIKETDLDVSGFDEVMIGSPIWNGALPPAINGLLSKLSLDGKEVSFLLYSGSGEGKKAEKKIKSLFGDKRIVFLKEPKKHREELSKLSDLD